MADEHDLGRTRAIGERALAYLKEFSVAPDPHNYALLFHHTAGYDRALSNAVSQIVQEHGRLTSADAMELHESFISPTSTLNALQEALNGQAAALANVVEEAAESANGFGASLHGAEDELQRSDNAEKADSILRDLVVASSKMAKRNQALEQQLADSKRQIEELRRTLATVRMRGDTDRLTRLPGRAIFRSRVAQALTRAQQQCAPLSVLIVDIDGFEAYNRAHGSQIADRILKFVADLIVEIVGPRCTVARYSGDQFAVLLPDASLESAVKLAEQIRANVMAKKFVRKSSGRSVGCVTVSIGAALYGHGDSADALIDRAVDCLGTAKKLGRNRVRSAANSDAPAA